MSPFHLFPTPLPTLPIQFPTTAAGQAQNQLPFQLQLQLATWHAFRLRQHQQNQIMVTNLQRFESERRFELSENKEKIMDDKVDSNGLSGEDVRLQDAQKASPQSNSENTISPPNGIHKPEPLMGNVFQLASHLLPQTTKSDTKSPTDFRFVESLIVREPLTQCNNQNNEISSPQSYNNQLSKEKRKRQEKASTSNSPPLIVRSCPICQKKFTRHWLLQGHIRTHTGERPFKCQICPKAFADKSNLRAHVQTHSGIKNHICQRCGKRFALKSYLSKHEESSCSSRHSFPPHRSMFFRPTGQL